MDALCKLYKTPLYGLIKYKLRLYPAIYWKLREIRALIRSYLHI